MKDISGLIAEAKKSLAQHICQHGSEHSYIVTTKFESLDGHVKPEATGSLVMVKLHMDSAVESWNRVARQFAKHGVVADVSGSPGKAPAKSGEVVVVAAHFGGQEVTALAKLLFSQDAIFVIDTKGHPPFRDPWKGVTKSISVIYKSNNDDLGMWRVFVGNADAESVWTPTAEDFFNGAGGSLLN
ncbi:hypothetical protein ColLi_09448 [Colletotrichum liriopes]|uniref:Uncharacterized protein n=1 Tax=Colletotrichum liriopes TaxID=708192 RepID=A0AA37GTS0_9PEZI|nr:hypothetical protein ColLi_09448 [Colletotrichum liriopes]